MAPVNLRHGGRAGGIVGGRAGGVHGGRAGGVDSGSGSDRGTVRDLRGSILQQTFGTPWHFSWIFFSFILLSVIFFSKIHFFYALFFKTDATCSI